MFKLFGVLLIVVGLVVFMLMQLDEQGNVKSWSDRPRLTDDPLQFVESMLGVFFLVLGAAFYGYGGDYAN